LFFLAARTIFFLPDKPYLCQGKINVIAIEEEKKTALSHGLIKKTVSWHW